MSRRVVSGVTDEVHTDAHEFMLVRCVHCDDVFPRWGWHRCGRFDRVVPWAEYVARNTRVSA